MVSFRFTCLAAAGLVLLACGGSTAASGTTAAGGGGAGGAGTGGEGVAPALHAAPILEREAGSLYPEYSNENSANPTKKQ